MQAIVVQAQAQPVQGPLTALETVRLKELERTVRNSLDRFLEVGRALAEICRLRLYRSFYPNFNAYCRHRFRIGDGEGRLLIKAAEAAAEAAPEGSGLPLPGRSQALALSRAEPGLRREAWEAALAETGGLPPAASRLERLAALARQGLGQGGLARLVADEEREARRLAARREAERSGRAQAALEARARESMKQAARHARAAGFAGAALLAEQALALCHRPEAVSIPLPAAA